jgi:hypothetical protein
MPLTYRLYRTQRIGTGRLISDPKEPGATRPDPFRSALDAYITQDETGQNFWDWVHDARPVRYALARCESGLHVVLAAHARISALSPECADISDLQTWLDGPVSADAAFLARLEGDGCSTAWLRGSTTRRQLVRYLMHLHVMMQDARHTKVTDLLTCMAHNLDTRLGDVPVGMRQAVRTWIEGKGLTTTQFKNTSKVREVLHYLRENIDWPTLTLGPLVL